MTRNWNIVRARLIDPFDPDNEEVDQQIEAMIAKQDAQGGHRYPEFHLPDSPRKSAKTPNDPDPRAYILDSALTASKRAAFRKRKEWARQRDTTASYTDTNVSKLDLPLRSSKRKADDAKHDEERGRQTKRRTVPDGRPTSPPMEDYLDY
ncbi:hypothetical protein SLS64_009071 [Diaporthe eres]|uniref:Uncharacterized protein n=1 Tax=Diaporthe eres TaxID=83184 RepID=A0ABR1NPX1_DIAER